MKLIDTVRNVNEVVEIKPSNDDWEENVVCPLFAPADIALLHERIVQLSESDMRKEELLVPYTAKGVIGGIRANMRVLKEDYDETSIRLQVRSGELELEGVKKMLET